MSSSDRYTFISADTHAGASDDVYREYIEPRYRVEFDNLGHREPLVAGAWDAPPRPLKSDTERNERQNMDGVVGEVVFPDAQPPFFPNTTFLSGPPRPEDYELRRAGVQALNRWMVDYCAQFPARRAGVGAVLLNDLDHTIAEVEWIAENGLRGGVQLPNITPDATWIPHLGDRSYDRLWAACQDLDVVVNMHLETSLPRLGTDPRNLVAFFAEAPFYAVRPLVLMAISGVFERFPRLRVALSEQPISLLNGMLAYLDPVFSMVRETGGYAGFALDEDARLPRSPGDYVRSNVWYTASPPLVGELEMIGTTIGFDHLMIGNDYPHSEGTSPFTVPVLRQIFHDWEPSAVRRVLAETPAALYGFDLDALAADSAMFGPLVDEIATPLTDLPDRPNSVLLANELAST